MQLTAAEAQSHELALLLESRCRRCAERVPGGTALRGGECPRCGASTAPTSGEQDALLNALSQRTGARFWLAATAAAAAILVLGWLPLLAGVVLAGSLVWIQVTIVRPGTRLLSRSRRIMARWTLRIAGGVYFALSLVLLEALTVLPFVGVLAKSIGLFGQVAFAGYFARTYLAWQSGRESRREPVSTGEIAALAVTGALVVGSAILVFATLFWLITKLSWLQALLVRGGAP